MSEPISPQCLHGLGFRRQGDTRPWVLSLSGQRELAAFPTGGVYMRNGISTLIGTATNEAQLIDLVRAVQAIQERE